MRWLEQCQPGAGEVEWTCTSTQRGDPMGRASVDQYEMAIVMYLGEVVSSAFTSANRVNRGDVGV